MGLAFSLDGQTVLTWGADGWARLWNVQGRYDRLAMVGYGCAGPGSIEHAHLSDDSERIVTVLRNGRADVWDKRKGTALLNLHTFAETRNAPPAKSWVPPQLRIASVASSPDLRQVLVDEGMAPLFSSPLPAVRRPSGARGSWFPRSLTTDERQRFFLAEQNPLMRSVISSNAHRSPFRPVVFPTVPRHFQTPLSPIGKNRRMVDSTRDLS